MDVNFTEWTLLIGALTPFLTAVAAKVNTPDWWKGLISLTLAVIAGVLIQVGESSLSDLSFDAVFSDAAAIWATHLLTWLGISKTAVTNLHQRTARFGLRAPSG